MEDILQLNLNPEVTFECMKEIEVLLDNQKLSFVSLYTLPNKEIHITIPDDYSLQASFELGLKVRNLIIKDYIINNP